MIKKAYVSPEMKVVMIESHAILAGSGGNGLNETETDNFGVSDGTAGDAEGLAKGFGGFNIWMD